MTATFISRCVLAAALLVPAVVAIAQPSDGASFASSSSSSSVTDRALRKKVKSALKSAQGLTALDIAVTAKHGHILLQGTVPSQDQIALAGKVAVGVPGVSAVSNSLTVNRPTNSWN